MNYDNLAVTFTDTGLLYNDFGQSVEKDTRLEEPVPLQYASQAEADFFGSLLESFDSIETGAFVSDIVLNMIIATILQKLWSMVKA